MNNNDYTLKLLNIQDDNIKFIKIELINKTYYIELEQIRSNSTCCPNCGGMEYTKNSIYTRRFKYIPINELPSVILLKQLRFKCNYCNHSFNQTNRLSIIESLYLMNYTYIFKMKPNINNLLKMFQLEQTFHRQQYQTSSKRIYTITDVN